MPLPLLPAAGALVAKAGAGAAAGAGAKAGMFGGLKAALSALTAGKGAGVVNTAYRTLKPIVGRKGARMAGDALHRMGRGLTSVGGFKKNLGIPMNKSDIAMTVAPDLLFGGMTALTTEGDIMDKAIAGVGSSVGGIAGGIGARGILGPKSGLGILGTEMIGGMVGDQVGYGVANSLIRAKHGGMTPGEKNQSQADALYKQQLMQELGLM